jgi:hypothetical protein
MPGPGPRRQRLFPSPLSLTWTGLLLRSRSGVPSRSSCPSRIAARACNSQGGRTSRPARVGWEGVEWGHDVGRSSGGSQPDERSTDRLQMPPDVSRTRTVSETYATTSARQAIVGRGIELGSLSARRIGRRVTGRAFPIQDRPRAGPSIKGESANIHRTGDGLAGEGDRGVWRMSSTPSSPASVSGSPSTCGFSGSARHSAKDSQ